VLHTPVFGCGFASEVALRSVASTNSNPINHLLIPVATPGEISQK